jgi:PKD domain-containing protein
MNRQRHLGASNSKNERARRWCLITFGCALLFFAPAYFAEVTGSVAIESPAPVVIPAPETSPSASPSPTARNSEAKRPNPVRRFFTWVVCLFRKPVPMISDPPHVSVMASPSVITICPPKSSSILNCSVDRLVVLSAITPVPGHCLFTWPVPAGSLTGQGRKVTWDLSGLAEGTYTATVEVNDGEHTAKASATVAVAICGACDPPPPPCPVLSVSCPNGIEPKQPITFEATVTGGDPAMTPTYTWKVSAGKIISGQGTSKIMVDIPDIAGQSITATVSLGGPDPSCTGTTASCTIESKSQR